MGEEEEGRLITREPDRRSRGHDLQTRQDKIFYGKKEFHAKRV